MKKINEYNVPTFLKWPGGKRKIIPALEKYFPPSIKRYFEPFLGGGSVFFYIKQKYNPAYSLISDINRDLINVYLDVRDNPDALIEQLKKLKKNNSKEFYYLTRESFNKGKLKGIKRSAVFIYLNKTCFNGIYRVNRKNEFNVPYGKIHNPGIFDEEIIHLASKLLNDKVDIRHMDYRELSGLIKKGDFIYLDPCYDPIKKTSFLHYTPDRFSISDRNNLHSFLLLLKEKRASIVLSNNDLPQIHSLYKGFNITKIKSPRSINSVGWDRGKIKELVICI